jgi:hypothetical protein
MFDRRAVVLLLLCANGVFWAWSSGWLVGLGWAPATESEPQRMSQQVSPYKLQLQKDKDPADTPAPPSSAQKP